MTRFHTVPYNLHPRTSDSVPEEFLIKNFDGNSLDLSGFALAKNFAVTLIEKSVSEISGLKNRFRTHADSASNQSL